MMIIKTVIFTTVPNTVKVSSGKCKNFELTAVLELWFI